MILTKAKSKIFLTQIFFSFFFLPTFPSLIFIKQITVCIRINKGRKKERKKEK